MAVRSQAIADENGGTRVSGSPAEGIETADEALLLGGTAGDQYDPCSHLVCDAYDNVDLDALDVNVDAVAVATPPALATEGASGSSDSSQGGLHDDLVIIRARQKDTPPASGA